METRQAIGDDLVQTLPHSLEKDLSDLPNLSDVRIRFIPRQALVNIISHQDVVQLLEKLPIRGTERASPPRNTASWICPQPEICHCGKKACTGARAILATLLLIGQEDLITLLVPSTELCDQHLLINATDSQAQSCATHGDQRPETTWPGK